MEKEKKAKSDFRYATGDARVPWAAVGENINVDDVAEIVKFLVPAGDNPSDYNEQFVRVKEEIEKLREKGRYATKLSLGSKVEELETKVKEFLSVKYACFVTNATAGFEIGLKFAGLRPGDEIIAPAITFCSTISPALEMVRDKGRIVIVGNVKLEFPRYHFYHKEVDLLISRSYGPGRYDPQYEEQGHDYPLGYVRWTENRNMRQFVSLIAQGKINVKSLITTTFNIEEGERAFDLVISDPEATMAVLLKY